MRIAYVIDKISGTGGLQRILIDKMNYLAEHSAHEIVLITIWHNGNKNVFPLSNKIRHVNLNVPLAKFPKSYLLTLPLAFFRFNKYLNRLRPDVAIVFRAIGAFLAATTFYNGKLIFESHLAYQFSNHNWLYPYMERRVDTVVCLTNGDAINYTQAKMVDVIPNFTNINTERLPYYSSKTVIFVGRDCSEKDIPRLKRIWAVVHDKYPDWQLKMHSKTKDMIKAYLEGSILVMTSKAEGLPMALIEAQSCGLPCVAFDCPYGPREIIEDGKTGYLIPYDDDQMFIDKLSALMDDEALRRKMGEAAKVASQRYQPAPIMAQWLKLFTSL